MVREKKVRLSDEEHQRLSEYRQDEYGTEEIPFGVVISDLLDKATNNDD